MLQGRISENEYRIRKHEAAQVVYDSKAKREKDKLELTFIIGSCFGSKRDKQTNKFCKECKWEVDMKPW